MLTRSTRHDFHTLLDAAVLSDDAPDTVAVIFIASHADPMTITRAHFRDRAAGYTAGLHERGIMAGDVVVIAHPHMLEGMFAFWGALIIGAIPSMFPTLSEKLDPAIYHANMNELVRLSSVRAVITSAEFAPLLHDLPCPVYTDDFTHAAAPPVHHPQPDSIAFLQHSSGTTGLQKGVALSHDAVLNQLADYADAIELSPADSIVSWLPLYHDMGLIAAFLQPLIQGVPLILMSPFDWVAHPVLLLDAIHLYKATLCWLPNFAYNHLAARVRPRESDGLDLASMRAFINCSEPVRHDSHTRFVERFAANGVTPNMLAVSYAMAENTFAVTQTKIGVPPTLDMIDQTALQTDLLALTVPPEHSFAAAQVSCGAPIAGSALKVVDARGEILQERRVGEILVQSECMLTGYYQRPDLHPFDAEGWYLTGDRGYLADGELYIVGRSKDLIIHAGKNVYPQDLEMIINRIDGIHAGRAVAFGVMNERDGTERIAIVAEVDSTEWGERQRITADIRTRIAAQTDVIVHTVALVERGWLIKTSSGKIARAANREKWLHEREKSSVRPQSLET